MSETESESTSDQTTNTNTAINKFMSGNSSSSSNFAQNAWDPQGQALTGFYGDAKNQYDRQQATRGDSLAFVQNAATDPWRNQMAGGAYEGGINAEDVRGSFYKSQRENPWEAQGYQGDAMRYEGPTRGEGYEQQVNNMIMGGAGNNYADAMKNQYVDDANRATQNMMQNMDSRAAAAGQSGGSRHGLATYHGMQGINDNLQRSLAETGYRTFDKDLDRKLNIARAADSNNLQRDMSMNQNNLQREMMGQQQNFDAWGQQQGMNLQGNQDQQQGNLQRQEMAMGLLQGKQDSINTGLANAPVAAQMAQIPWEQYQAAMGTAPTLLNSGASESASAERSGEKSVSLTDQNMGNLEGIQNLLNGVGIGI